MTLKANDKLMVKKILTKNYGTKITLENLCWLVIKLEQQITLTQD